MMVKVSGSASAVGATKKTTAKAAPKATRKAAPKATKTAAKAAPKTAPKPVMAAEVETAVVEVVAPPAPQESAAPAEMTPMPVEPKLVTSTVPVVTGPEMKKKELVDRVVTRSGIKKKDAKPVVEAMLAVLGEAMAEGRELNLQPMGRLKVARVKDTGNGQVLVCRVRQGGGNGNGDKEALAEDDD